MVKRIFQCSICFFMAILILFSCSVSANALSVSEFSGLLTAMKDFGEWAMPVIAEAGNEIGSVFNSDICPGSSAGGGRHVFELTATQVDGVPGNYYVCKNCGKYAGDAFDDSYSSYVSTLEGTEVSSLSFDVASDVGIDSCGWYSKNNALDTPSTVYSFSQSGFNCSYRDSATSNRQFRFYSSPFSLAEGDYTLNFSGEANYCGNTGLVSGFNIGLRPLFFWLYRISADGTQTILLRDYSVRPDVTGSTYYSFDVDFPVFHATADYTYQVVVAWASSANETDVYRHLNMSVTCSPASDSSDLPASSRPAALMQAIDDYNATDGSSKYYIGSADSSGQITNVYSPNIFIESTKVFTEPVTGAQYQCTDWQYSYVMLGDAGLGGYRLDLKDGTYIYNGKSIRAICLLYYDDYLLVVGFSRTMQELFDLGVMGPTTTSTAGFWRYAEFSDQYAYIIESEPEAGACVHNYVPEIIAPATCTESGTVQFTCSLCGDTYTAPLAPVGHDYTSEVTAESTCLTRGVITYTCSTCGDTYTEIIPALGHNYALVSDVDPTCTEEGVTTYACSLCGASYRETTPSLGHDWQLIDTVEPVYDDGGNVVEVGYSLYECSRCHQQFVDYDGDGPPADMDGTSCASYWEWWKEAWNDFVTKLFSFLGIEIDPDADPDAPESTVGFWERIKNAFLDALATLIEKVLGFITEVLGAILDLVYDLLSFFFNFLTGTVISGISGFFSSFTDGSLFQFFQSEDGTGYALPEGVASVFAFFSAIFLCLPADLRYVLMFGIGLIIFLAVFKLVKS